MFQFFKDKLQYMKTERKFSRSPELPETSSKLTENLNDNLITIMEKYRNSSDFLKREILLDGHSVAILADEGMIDLQTMTEMIFEPLQQAKFSSQATPTDIYDYIEQKIIIGIDVTDVYDCESVFSFIMSGFIVILIDGLCKGIAVGVQGFQFRSISEPSSEINLRGSREGFTEPIRINLTMIRRRIKSPDMKFELFKIGKVSNTDVCMVYMNSKVSDKLLREIRHKLRNIDMDIILESGYIQPFLQGSPWSFFSDVGTTERPDTLCAKICEGRVGILVDGTPFALIVPYLFNENFQSIDDYCHKPYFATFIRWIKYISFFTTILLPGVYVAVGTFHPELFPHALLFNIAAAEETTPLPLVLEALVIHFIYEIMHEAGLRLPRPVGHAVSIVGGLVIGDAEVIAGLIGAPMVMVVALTAISSFVVPSLYESVSILRFGFIIIGGISGLYGITLGLAFLSVNLSKLNNFGAPYLAPLSPFSLKAMKDVLIRAGWHRLSKSNAKIQDFKGVDID